METAIHFVAHGRVQGVSYRAFAQRAAERFGLAGWVRNLRDGTVEGICEGPSTKVQAFLSELQRGPAFGDVTRLLTEEIPTQHSVGFEIRFNS